MRSWAWGLHDTEDKVGRSISMFHAWLCCLHLPYQVCPGFSYEIPFRGIELGSFNILRMGDVFLMCGIGSCIFILSRDRMMESRCVGLGMEFLLC